MTNYLGHDPVDYPEWARTFVHDCVVGNKRFEDRVAELLEFLKEVELNASLDAIDQWTEIEHEHDKEL